MLKPGLESGASLAMAARQLQLAAGPSGLPLSFRSFFFLLFFVA